MDPDPYQKHHTQNPYQTKKLFLLFLIILLINMDTDFNYDLDESRIQILGHISRSTALLERERGIKPFVRKGKYPLLHPYTE